MRQHLKFLIVSAAAAALCACASTDPHKGTYIGVDVGTQPRAQIDPDASVYGLFLAGQSALYAGDGRSASDFFTRAQAEAPRDADLRNRALTAALLSGDLKSALEFKPATDTPESIQQLAQLSRGVELMAEGRNAEAFVALNENGPGAPVSSEAALLRAWAAAGAGRWQDATAMPDIKDRLYRLIGVLDQALLMERQKRYGDAETAFKAALSEKAGRPLIVPAYGVFLERRGRQKDAVALYDQALTESPGDPALMSARQRASSGGKAPAMLSIREGAAQALMAPAGSLMADKAPQSALIYFRMIMRLDPTREDSLMMVADIQADGGDKAAAREIYARIPKTSDRYLTARARLAFTYQDSDKAQALAIARETAAAAPDSEDSQLVLADVLRTNEHYEESNKILDTLIAKEGARANWRLYYMRGAGEDRADKWPAAEADLQKALSLHPDDAELLNYLGYAWISRGEHVQDGMKMIQKAVDQEPDNGAYVDSLGWAYFKTGDYRSAVEKLEHATELDAGDAEINDHLGDAYWKVGRKDEARFKWRAVLGLQPDPEVKTRAEAKLNSPQGVDAVGPSRAIARQ